jgi:hypothetical protein
MRRYKKLIFVMISVLCLAGIGAVPTKRPQPDAEPFPGARVILDDAAWRSLWKDGEVRGRYEWAAPNLLVYHVLIGSKLQTSLRRYLPEGTFAPPQSLNPLLAKGEVFDSISLHGTTLCLWKMPDRETYTYRLVRLDGDGKPITFVSKSVFFQWSPDSRSLYGIAEANAGQVIERIDARTGSVVKAPVTVPNEMDFHSVTLEGKLLFFSDDTNIGIDPQMQKWRIGELRGKTVHAASYQTRFPDDPALPSLSPDGKRLLWLIYSTENTLWEHLQNTLQQKKIPPKPVTRWQITDADGNNPHTLGIIGRKEADNLQQSPRWTPDSKGVYFVYEKKLWRLDVP